MRRALSSDRGFLGFFDIGFGFDGSVPSFNDQGSGLILEKDLIVILGFVLVGFGKENLEGRSWVGARKLELRESMFGVWHLGKLERKFCSELNLTHDFPPINCRFLILPENFCIKKKKTNSKTNQ